MTREVAAETKRLEFAQFQYPEDRDQITAIRLLALQQVADDVANTSGSRRDRIGQAATGWVLNGYEDYDNGGESLWRRWTPEQQALETGLAPFLGQLSSQQREVVHLRYWGRLSVRQTAIVLGIAPSTIQVYEERALKTLRAALEESFLPDQELESA